MINPRTYVLVAKLISGSLQVECKHSDPQAAMDYMESMLRIRYIREQALSVKCFEVLASGTECQRGMRVL